MSGTSTHCSHPFWQIDVENVLGNLELTTRSPFTNSPTYNDNSMVYITLNYDIIA